MGQKLHLVILCFIRDLLISVGVYVLLGCFRYAPGVSLCVGCLALFLLCCMLNVRIDNLLFLCNLLIYEHFMLDWKG